MAIEKIMADILSSRPELSREELLKRLEKDRKRTAGLISNETLLRMIAAEFEVAVPKGEDVSFAVSIKDLVPSLNNVSVTGRVVAVLPPRALKGRANGKFVSLFVADQSGVLRVVLWNSKVSLVESDEVKVGRITRFSGGYTKEARDGGVELHVGGRSHVEVDPKGVDAKGYPTISKFSTKIGKIVHGCEKRKVNVVGTVMELFPASTFQRQDSSSGKVMRFVIADETGEMPLVLWNEKADALEKTLRKGAKLQIVDARVRKGRNGLVEIHVDSGAHAEILVSESEFSKIADLREGAIHINIEGLVVTKPMIRDVRTSKGDTVRLAVFELRDDTSRIWVSAWGDKVNAVNGLKLGDSIAVKNGYVRKGFGDQLEVSTRTGTSIVVSPKNN